MPSAGDIADRWQNEIDHEIEAGGTPILDLGVGSLTTASAAALLALQLLAARRDDAARPVVIAGGPNSAWPALLLPPLPPATAQGVFQPTIFYTGATPAEHMASAAITHAAVDAPGFGRPTDAGIVAAAFQPGTRPGSPAAWETLPFLHTYNHADASFEEAERAADPTADWLAWAVLLLALFLVILAILL